MHTDVSLRLTIPLDHAATPTTKHARSVIANYFPAVACPEKTKFNRKSQKLKWIYIITPRDEKRRKIRVGYRANVMGSRDLAHPKPAGTKFLGWRSLVKIWWKNIARPSESHINIIQSEILENLPQKQGLTKNLTSARNSYSSQKARIFAQKTQQKIFWEQRAVNAISIRLVRTVVKNYAVIEES